MFFRPNVILNAATRAAAVSNVRHQAFVRAMPAAATRFYSIGSLSHDQIESRVLDIVKGFEKVDSSKVTNTATFTDDLGLDSLDAVEVVMAIEEEFGVEISDKDADEIKSTKQAIDYIATRPDAQ